MEKKEFIPPIIYAGLTEPFKEYLNYKKIIKNSTLEYKIPADKKFDAILEYFAKLNDSIDILTDSRRLREVMIHKKWVILFLYITETMKYQEIADTFKFNTHSNAVYLVKSMHGEIQMNRKLKGQFREHYAHFTKLFGYFSPEIEPNRRKDDKRRNNLLQP